MADPTPDADAGWVEEKCPGCGRLSGYILVPDRHQARYCLECIDKGRREEAAEEWVSETWGEGNDQSYQDGNDDS